MGPVLYRPASTNVPYRCAGGKWRGGTETKLRSSNRGLDVAHRGPNGARRGFGLVNGLEVVGPFGMGLFYGPAAAVADAFEPQEPWKPKSFTLPIRSRPAEFTNTSRMTKLPILPKPAEPLGLDTCNMPIDSSQIYIT
jgi:hypothetical protein